MGSSDEHAERKYVIRKRQKDWEITDRTISSDASIRKYHPSIRMLSSLVSKGLMLDRESWYSVTPESVSRVVVKRVERAKTLTLTTSRTILCAYCGIGGDALVFLRSGYNVICSDIVYRKIKYLKNNYQVLRGVCRSVGSLTCITSDFFQA